MKILLVDDDPVVSEISRAVLEKAGHGVLTRDWRESGLPALRVSVNVSTRQIRHPGFQHVVERVLDQTRLDPSLLELEITESVFLDEDERLRETLAGLRASGVTFSIDDFGTGYSSLSYLKRFPIETLKIDRTFIRDVGQACENEAIVAMSHELGLGVVAEGVETRGEEQYLRTLGCDACQGFHFARPLDPADFVRFVTGGGKARGGA